jgi:mTERF
VVKFDIYSIVYQYIDMLHEKALILHEPSVESILNLFNIDLHETTRLNINSYLELGFTIRFLEKEAVDNLLMRMKRSNIKIDELKALGFENPVKMITSLPAILGYSIKENIQPKIDELKALGFENPVKMITSLPAILGLSIKENIQPKIDELKALGFENPVKMITSLPAILGLSIKENIQPKIDELKALGFENPVKMITSSPAILGYSIKENIQPKIDELKALGFENPVKMITSLPAILGLSIKENIQPKIKRIQTYLDLYKIEFTAIDLIQYFPTIIGYSRLRLFKTASYLRDKNLPLNKKPLKGDICNVVVNLKKLTKN